MSRKKQGNPNKSSRFICLKCGNQNHVGDGIQRLHQRERLHIKDMYCIICRQETKNLEVRYCDYITLEEIENAKQLNYGGTNK